MTVSGVQHAGELLELFTPLTPDWGATDAARRLGISKSHAHRLLTSLAELGFVERQPGSRRYRLGWRCLGFAAIVLETSPIAAHAMPIMRSLRKQYDVEAALSVWNQDAVVSLRPFEDPLIVRRPPGDRIAITAVLAAACPDTPAATAPGLARQAHSVAHSNIASQDRVRHVRAGGLVGEYEPGACGAFCLAAPVLDADGAIVAALSVDVPRLHWEAHKHDIIRGLRSAALRLSASVAAG
ncbi:IclR family transcriptional regulator [Kribbella sp. VKM Ac-2527]|uniref:Glycerol operon regulatory protein n=1 Tax=Kribbella caucasensis TaxID=2512215 RepID=A0A4R6KKN3_9ACTN|nr:helix-turn-helix domain-containing protein [Kribbella sp. VKM Ac-2527]TDO51733.1 IclR family transcriptional regulator [Kribbella sp. VKM Ac-2527]